MFSTSAQEVEAVWCAAAVPLLRGEEGEGLPGGFVVGERRTPPRTAWKLSVECGGNKRRCCPGVVRASRWMLDLPHTPARQQQRGQPYTLSLPVPPLCTAVSLSSSAAVSNGGGSDR